MTTSDAEASWDVEPASALRAVAAHRGPVIVDFDETLLLANSTSLFVDAARPSLAAYLLLKLVDLLGRRQRRNRDARRVWALLTFLPWLRFTWPKRARTVARDLANQPLIDALRLADGPIVVATMGFGPVVEPILAELGLDNVRLVAIDPGYRGNRAEAKASATTALVGEDGMTRSLVITDSLADRELLAASGTPLRVLWPEVRQTIPFQTVYVPGRYITIKRPKAKTIRRIVQDDLALWILGSVWLADRPIPHVIGLVVLAVSFWAIYETGYLDNDRVAERYEPDPVLSDLYFERPVDIRPWKPLLWAAAVGVVGLWILRWPDPPEGFDYLRWGGVLVVTLVVFGFYNRMDKQTRVLIYPLLQLLRGGAFLAVVSTTAIADAALIIMALIRWVNYYIYRTRDRKWPTEDLTVVRFIVFVAAAGLLSAQHEWSDFVSPTTLSLLAWSAFLARRSIPNAIRSAERIDRPRPSSVA